MPTDQVREVGRRIREARIRANLSLEQIRHHFGIAKRTVQQWEAGKVDIPISRVFAVAEPLKADPVWLFTGQGDGPQLQCDELTEDAKRRTADR